MGDLQNTPQGGQVTICRGRCVAFGQELPEGLGMLVAQRRPRQPVGVSTLAAEHDGQRPQGMRLSRPAARRQAGEIDTRGSLVPGRARGELDTLRLGLGDANDRAGEVRHSVKYRYREDHFSQAIFDMPEGDVSLELYDRTAELDIAGIVDLVLDRLGAASSKVMYRRALRDFLAWYAALPAARFDKATVQRYRAHLLKDGKLAPASVNQKLSAIRGLAQEASDNGLIDLQLAHGISKVKGVKTAGTRIGTWLTEKQAQQLLDAPDIRTLKGVRDQAILAVLLGCGLRRAEAAALTFGHVQQWDGRWVVVDLVGKGQRVRSVPIPSWTKAAIDAWATAAAVSSGHVFRSLRKGGRLDGSSMTDQAIADVVAAYGDPLK